MRRTLENLISVIGGEMLLKLANFAAFVVVARMYGPATLGRIASALAITGIVFMFAAGGLQTSAIVETGRRSATLAQSVSRLFWVTSLVLLPLAAAIVAWGPWAGLGLQDRAITGLVAFRMTLQFWGQTQIALLKALDRMGAIARSQLVHFGFLVAWLAAASHFAWGVYVLLSGFVLAQFVESVLTGAVLKKAGASFESVRWGECARLLKRSLPLGMSQGLSNIVMRLDVAVLSVLVASAEVGTFAAAHALLVLGYVVSWLLGSVLLPDLVRLSGTPEALRPYLSRWARLVGFAGVLFSVVAFWAAPAVLSTLLGSGFETSGRMASLLAVAFPLILLNALCLNHALARGWDIMCLRAQVATAAFSLVLSGFLALEFSAWGIAAAVPMREMFFWILLRRGTARLASEAPGDSSLKAASPLE